MGADGSEEDDWAAMPLADLLLALGASFLVALFAVQPALRQGPDARAQLEAGAVSIDGRSPLLLFAERDGVVVEAADGAFVPLAAIASDPLLADRLRRTDEAGTPILVAIRPDGQEAAFLLEAALSAASVEALHQIRLTGACDPSGGDGCGLLPEDPGS